MKKNQQKQKHFKGVRLYLDDFYHLTEILKECSSMTIEGDGWSMENPQEIEKLNKSPVRELSVRTFHPTIWIHLSPYSAEVGYFDEGDSKATGIFSRTADIIASSQSPLFNFFTNSLVLLFFVYLDFGHFHLAGGGVSFTIE